MALDDATAEIERLTTELEQSAQRASAKRSKRERDELRAELNSVASDAAAATSRSRPASLAS